MSLALGTSNISFNRIINNGSDALRPILVLNKNSGATIHGSCYWNGTYHGRLHFDGSGDYCRFENVIVHRTNQYGSSGGNITIATHLGAPGNASLPASTISFWWKMPSGHTETGHIFAVNTNTGGNVLLVGLENNKPHIYLDGARTNGTGNSTYSWVGSTAISSNTWTMFTIVFGGGAYGVGENGGYAFYINGSLVKDYDPGASTDNPRHDLDTSNRWTLGGEWDSNNMTDYVKGDLQHFAVWDVALSPGAVEILYNDGETDPPSIVMGTPKYISSWNSTTIGCPVPTHRIIDSTSGINKYNTEWYNNTWVLNGTNAYVRLEGAILSTFQGQSIMSFCCWVWHENSSSSGSDVIYSDHAGTSTDNNRNIHKLDGPTGLFRYYYYSDDKFRFYKHMEYNWTHYAFVKNGGSHKIYINGKPLDEGVVEYRSTEYSTASGYTFTTWPSTYDSSFRFSIGHEWDTNAGDFFKGMLKNVHFWSTELTDEQVAGVFRAEFGRSGISMNGLRGISKGSVSVPFSGSISINSHFKGKTFEGSSSDSGDSGGSGGATLTQKDNTLYTSANWPPSSPPGSGNYGNSTTSSGWTISGSGIVSGKFYGNSTNGVGSGTHSTRGVVSFEVTGNGTLHFKTTVSSEINYDYGRVILKRGGTYYYLNISFTNLSSDSSDTNNDQKARGISGSNVTFNTPSNGFAVNNGDIIQFEYYKDGSVDNNDDKYYIDELWIE